MKPRSRSSVTPTVAFASLTLLLAGVIWVHGVTPAEHRLNRQLERHGDLELAVERERRESHRLKTLLECLRDDPQTVERGLRDAGFGRAGDLMLVVDPGDK